MWNYIITLIGFISISVYCKDVDSTVLHNITLTSSRNSLQRFTLHNGYVLVGGTNLIYRLNSTLKEDKRVITGPLEDNLKCLPNPNKPCNVTQRSLKPSINQILLPFTNTNELLVCSTLYYGYCSIYNVDTFKLIRNVYKNVAPFTDKSSVSAIFIPSITRFFVSTFIYHSDLVLVPDETKYQVFVPPLIASRDTAKLAIDFMTQQSSKVKIRRDLNRNSDFHVEYIDSFSEENGVYFLLVRNNTENGKLVSEHKTFLAKLCVEDLSMRSYIEMEVQCGDYNEAISMDHSLNSKSIITILFRKSSNGKYALCSYPMSNIKLKFMRNYRACYKGEGEVGPSYLVESKQCIKHETVSDYCGEERDNTPILSHYPLTTDTTYHLPDMPISSSLSSRPQGPPLNYTGESLHSLAVVNASDDTKVALLGTSHSRILKMALYKDSNAGDVSKPIYDILDFRNETNLNMEPILQLKRISDTNILAMTQTALVRFRPIKSSDCSRYTDCLECLAAEDPACGWCILDSKCTRKSICRNPDTDHHWLNSAKPMYNNEYCPLIIRVLERNVDYHEFKKYKMTIEAKGLPVSDMLKKPIDKDAVSHVALNSVKCSISQETEVIYTRVESIKVRKNKSTGSSIYVIQCAAFPTGPKFHGGFKKSFIDMDISITITTKPIVQFKRKLLIYKCDRATLCSTCELLSKKKNKFPCIWSINDGACKTSKAPVTLPKCPIMSYIDFSTKKFRHVDTEVNLKMSISNIQKKHLDNVKCMFDNEKYNITSRNYDENTSIGIVTCPSIILTYSEKTVFKSMTVDLIYESGNKFDRDLTDTTITVYKCAGKDINCGNCQNSNVGYNCAWCSNLKDMSIGYCGFRSCKTNYKQIANGENCPNPKIISMEPMKTHLYGGVVLKIKGYNLAINKKQVKINIGDSKCELRHHPYSPYELLSCTLGKAEKPFSSPVEIYVNGNDKVIKSKEIFHYLDPKVFSTYVSKGPKSGGTLFKIKGENLSVVSDRVVEFFLDSTNVYKVVVKQSKTIDNYLAIYTPPVRTTGKYNVKVTFPKIKYEKNFTYTYEDDPVILSISPTHIIESGGINIIVKGERLDTIASPKMILYHQGKEKLKIHCKPVSANEITCPIEQIPRLSLTFDYGFSMDKVQSVLRVSTSNSLLQPIQVLRDPDITTWKSVKPVNPGNFIKISGSNLHTSEYKELITTTIGGVKCTMADFSENFIKYMVPEKDKVEMDNNNNALVMIQLGNYKLEVGYVNYKETGGGSSNNALVGQLIYLVPGILIPSVVVLSLVMFIVLRRRHNKKRNKFLQRPEPLTGSRVRRDARHGPSTSAEQTELQPLRPSSGYNAPGVLDPGPTSALLGGWGSGGPGSGDDPASGYVAPVSSTVPPTTIAATAGGTNSVDVQRQIDAIIAGISDSELRDNVQGLLIARNRLDMGNSIGKGHFGCVYQATLKGEHGHSIKVAVKTMGTEDNDSDANDAEQFLREGSIMMNFKHPHILSILGMCIESTGVAMVILPYMANGDLRKYVKHKSRDFTARNLLRLAQQVTEGMAYLSYLKFVHRDLAARNCMIDDKLVVKVADFGLTRASTVYEKESRPSHAKEMPVKWMSLESLESHIFTTKSDVWSFGVLLWELMTRCLTPYPDQSSQDIISFLHAGHRLRQPKHCPETIYTIMKECWNVNPNERPTFADLVNRLELMLRPPNNRRPPLNETSQVYMNIRSESDYLEPTTVPT